MMKPSCFVFLLGIAQAASLNDHFLKETPVAIHKDAPLPVAAQQPVTVGSQGAPATVPAGSGRVIIVQPPAIILKPAKTSKSQPGAAARQPLVVQQEPVVVQMKPGEQQPVVVQQQPVVVQQKAGGQQPVVMGQPAETQQQVAAQQPMTGPADLKNQPTVGQVSRVATDSNIHEKDLPEKVKPKYTSGSSPLVIDVKSPATDLKNGVIDAQGAVADKTAAAGNADSKAESEDDNEDEDEEAKEDTSENVDEEEGKGMSDSTSTLAKVAEKVLRGHTLAHKKELGASHRHEPPEDEKESKLLLADLTASDAKKTKFLQALMSTDWSLEAHED